MEREHLGGLDSDSHSARTPSKGQYLLHANMPNIRIALVISQFGYDLYSDVLGSRMERGLSARLEILRWQTILHGPQRPHPPINASRCRRRRCVHWLRPRRGDKPRRQTPGLRQRNPEVRRARSPRVMAIGKTEASPRMFNAQALTWLLGGWLALGICTHTEE